MSEIQAMDTRSAEVSPCSPFVSAEVCGTINDVPGLHLDTALAEKTEVLTRVFGKCAHKGCRPNKAGSPKPSAINPADPILFYSNAMHCMSHHEHTDPNKLIQHFSTICEFERLVISSLKSISPGHIEVLRHGSMNLCCEQDVESLALKSFQVLHRQNRDFQGQAEILNSILSLLLERKEYERFFSVYDMRAQSTLRVFKLALQASLFFPERCHRKILEDLAAYLNLPEKPGNTKGPHSPETRSGSSESGKGREIYQSIESWFGRKHREHYWNFAVLQWNSSKNAEGSSEAMLDLCSRFREFEHGWSVYKETLAQGLPQLRISRLSSRAVGLIVKAINAHATTNWIERLLEVCTVISRLQIKDALKIRSTFSAVLGIERYAHASYIAGRIIRQYPQSLASSSSLGIILGDTLRLLEKHKDLTEKEAALNVLPDMIRDVLKFYLIWKEKTSRGLLSAFFFGYPEETVEVFALLLQLGLVLRQHDLMLAICQDLWDSGAAVSEDVSDPLFSIHATVCQCSDHAAIWSVRSRKYLAHTISKLSAASKGKRCSGPL